MPNIYSTLIKEHIKRFKLKKKDFIFLDQKKKKIYLCMKILLEEI